MKSHQTMRRFTVAACVALATAGTALAGQDVQMHFSDAQNPAPTTVEVQIQIQNPDGTWGTVFVGPITIPAKAPAAVKRDLIKAALQQTFGAANVTDSGAAGLNLHVNLQAAVRAKFLPGATGENPDKVVAAAAVGGSAEFAAVFSPYDYDQQPAIFTAGIVTDVGELTANVSAEELNFQTEGPIICQALFQRLAPRAPQYGAQVNYAGDRLEIYFDPAYTVTQGGIVFGTTSASAGCAGETVLPPKPLLVGDMNCDGVVDFLDINAFVQYVSNCAQWQAQHPDCPPEVGDIDGDGQHACNGNPFDDINAFVALLTHG